MRTAQGQIEVLHDRRDTPSGSLAPTTFEEYLRLSEQLAKSELVPKDFQGKPANVFVALQLGADLGISPMQAIQGIAVFGGKPTIYGDLGLALAFRSGLLIKFEESYDEAAATAHCIAQRVGMERPIERTFGQKDAERIQVWDRESGKWKKLSERHTYISFPQRMHQMRARWWALRDVIPDVFKGLRGHEEMDDNQTEEPPAPKDMGRVKRADDDNPYMPREIIPAVDMAASAAGVGAPDPGPALSSGGSGGDVPPGDDLPRDAGGPGPALSSGGGGGNAGGVPPGDKPSRDAGDPVPDPPGVAPDAPAPLSALEGGDRTTLFELNGQRFATCGVTKTQMLGLFKLCGQVNRIKGKTFDKNLLRIEFHVTTRSDLTEEAAERYRVRLAEIIEASE